MCRVGEGQRLELTERVPCMANIICHHQGLSRGEDLGNGYDTHALLFLSVHTPDLVHIHRGLAVSVWIPALEVLLGSTHSGRPGVGPASNEKGCEMRIMPRRQSESSPSIYLILLLQVS